MELYRIYSHFNQKNFIKMFIKFLLTKIKSFDVVLILFHTKTIWVLERKFLLGQNF